MACGIAVGPVKWPPSTRPTGVSNFAYFAIAHIQNFNSGQWFGFRASGFHQVTGPNGQWSKKFFAQPVYKIFSFFIYFLFLTFAMYINGQCCKVYMLISQNRPTNNKVTFLLVISQRDHLTCWEGWWAVLLSGALGPTLPSTPFTAVSKAKVWPHVVST